MFCPWSMWLSESCFPSSPVFSLNVHAAFLDGIVRSEIQSFHVIVMDAVFVRKTPGAGGLAWSRSRSTCPLLLQLSPPALVAPGPTENPRRGRWFKDFLESDIDPLKEIIVMDLTSLIYRLGLVNYPQCSADSKSTRRLHCSEQSPYF